MNNKITHASHQTRPTDKHVAKHMFDNPANINRVVIGLYLACAASIFAEFFIHKHGHFAFENWFGFHAMFGFASYVFLIFVAKRLRHWLKRDESYYEQREG